MGIHQPGKSVVQLTGSTIADPLSLVLQAEGPALSPAIPISDQDGNYNAFPGLLRLQNGDMLAAYRVSTVHTIDDPGPLVMKRSTDGGRRWGAAETLLDERPDADLRDIRLFQSITGRVFASFARRPQPSGNTSIGILTSDDDGGTWTDRSAGAASAISESSAHPYGSIVEFHHNGLGNIILSYYGGGSAYTLRSGDDGESWKQEKEIGSGVNEVAIADLTGLWSEETDDDANHPALVAIGRPSSGNGAKRAVHYSGSASFWEMQAGTLDVDAHSPELTVGPNFELIMAYRRGDNVPMIAISPDLGVTWQPLFRQSNRRGGYAQIVPLGGDVYAVAYYVDDGVSPTTTEQGADVFIQYFKAPPTRIAPRLLPEGYAQTTLNSGSAETITRVANHAEIVVQVEAGEVRVRTDGTAPTATVGRLIGAGFEERFAASSLQVIETASSATIQTWSD